MGGTWSIPITCADGGVTSESECRSVCRVAPDAGEFFSGCSVVPGGPNPPGMLIVCSCTTNGRAYAGMPPPETPGQTTAVGRYLAASAHLEAASIDAFAILEAELSAHDAPLDLVAAARACQADEARHAEVTSRLARRHGFCDARSASVSRPPRPLEDIAVENAVEGCVRETYAAVVAHHQAEVASDREVREAMRAIAIDETRHAALAWSVAAWATSRLDAEGQAKVARAREGAALQLRDALRESPPAPLSDQLGVPDAGDATRMLDVLWGALWFPPPLA